MSPHGRGRDPGRRALLKAGTALAGIAGLAGCTDLFQDGDDTETPAPARTVTPTATLTPAETATPMDTDAPTMTATDAPTPQGTETPTTTPTPTPAATETPTPTPDRDRIAASDGDADDSFGSSVAVAGDGNTALVGAAGDEDPNGAGSAYVFRRSGGTWVQQAKLAADDDDDPARFGGAVAVSSDGSTALVGAPGEETQIDDGDETEFRERGGAAYVFQESGGEWSQKVKIRPEDSTEDDRFGGAVALTGDGTTAVVGASGHAEAPESDVGAAFVFERRGGAWKEVQRLDASDRDEGDRFGSSVAVAGDGAVVLVGADGDDEPNGSAAGSAYVFRESSTIAWSREAKIAPDGGDDGDRFGGAAALTGDGTTALVGASQRDASGGAAGAAYVFERDGGDWPEQDRLDASDGDGSDRFGSSVALADDGTTAIVGANGDGDGAGSAYLLERSEETWSERAKLAAGDDGDSFGSSVALAGDRGTALVGADGDGAGSAYVFSF